MDLNKLAKDISKIEGSKKQVNISQIKEVQKCLFILIGKKSDKEILSTVNRYRKKY